MQGTDYDFNVFESQYKNYIIYETAKQGERKDLKQDKNVIKKSEKYNNKNYEHEQLNLKKKKIK